MSNTALKTLLIDADAVAPQAWKNGGGQTRELLAWPDANSWQMRVSRADIKASGPFSAFPGVQRWFQVLSGKGVILRMPTPDQHTLDETLLPGHIPLHFDGAMAPDCVLVDGPTLDLNLMARGGAACLRPVQTHTPWRADFAMCGLYSAAGGHWHCGKQSVTMPAHSLLWLEQSPSSPMRFVATAQADPALDNAWWLGFTPEGSPWPKK
jgi:environmental stress-induced protein Ves